MQQQELIQTTRERKPTSDWEYWTYCVFCELPLSVTKPMPIRLSPNGGARVSGFCGRYHWPSSHSRGYQLWLVAPTFVDPQVPNEQIP